MLLRVRRPWSSWSRGQLEAFLVERLFLWEHAPWILLVEEAGGSFTDRMGGRRTAHASHGIWRTSISLDRIDTTVRLANPDDRVSVETFRAGEANGAARQFHRREGRVELSREPDEEVGLVDVEHVRKRTAWSSATTSMTDRRPRGGYGQERRAHGRLRRTDFRTSSSGPATACSVATGEDPLLDHAVHAPVAVDHLSDTEVGRHRQQRYGLVLGQVLSRHEKAAHLPERVAHRTVEG